jgi:hypothetical protein
MPLQDVAHSLVADDAPEVGQDGDKTIVAPGAISLRHTDNQDLQLPPINLSLITPELCETFIHDHKNQVCRRPS